MNRIVPTSSNLISVVVPCFNEAASLEELVARVGKVMAAENVRHELVMVDDGSTDRSWSAIAALAAANPNLKALRLSRNFGKETAILAGLDLAEGDAVVLMDADLQHPPELIAEFLKHWREGRDMVHAARRDRHTDHDLHTRLARGFYKFFNAIADVHVDDDAGDFRLISRRVVDVILRLRERSRFTKGIFAWVGFESVAVPYDVAARRHGMSSFSNMRLWKLAFDGVVSFSTAPLRLGILIGALSATAALLLGTYFAVKTIFLGADVPGYASIIVSVLALGGLTMLQLGLIGLYVGRIHEEVKGRPSYIIRDAVGTDNVRVARGAPLSSEHIER